MKYTVKITLALLFAAAILPKANAQYYNEGQDPFSTRWMQLKTDRYRLIYPEQNALDARRVSVVIDTAFQALHYGFSRRAMRLPVILHTRNLNSNGVVTWTPRRSELITTPQTETFAVPWLKQLTVHEYRHVVQVSNLNRHVFKAFSWILGEQSVGAANIFVPKWFLEGDAVFAETSMAVYGRALQPEFTIAYRAYLADGDISQFATDKWFCGSYKDYIPNHYYLGYQLVNATYKEYGSDFWETVVDHVTRHPYQIFPRPVAFRKYYDTSSGQIFRETFRRMKADWDQLPAVQETMAIVPTPTRSYTTYSYPVPVSEVEVIAHKSDFIRPGRLVSVDLRTGGEEVLAYTGNLSSRPVKIGAELWWTEYKPSAFWEQKNRSVVRRMPVDGKSAPKTVSYPGNLFYVTPYGDGQFAAVEYDPAKKYSIVFLDAAFRPVRTLPISNGITVHGLAWEEKTRTLAAIFLREEGMNLERILPEVNGTEMITRPSYVTINHLTAGGGKLFFNSIRSGVDESHFYDLEGSGQEYRLSASKFGTVMPSVDAASGLVAQASYRRNGYLLSTQRLSDSDPEPVHYFHEPVNRVNPEMAGFDLPNLDGMELFAVADRTEKPVKRYRKGAHLFNLHSWAPVSFDVFDAADSNDRNLDFNVGATIMSQSDLSNTEAYLTYGYVDSHSWWRAGLRFLALAPKFEIDAEYDGGNRLMVRPDNRIPVPSGWAEKKYFSIQGRAYLPINLTSGGTLRSLTPSVSLSHYNTAIWQPDKNNFVSGYEKTEFALSYAQNSRMAYRDLAPRWGFGVRGSWATAPFNDRFGSLWSLYGNVYVPGALANHSLRLRGVVQGQNQKYYHFGSNVLFPRGCVYNFSPEDLWTVTGEYRFPVAYPDWGIDQFLYIKRISLNAFAGYSRYTPVGSTRGWEKAYSYGGELMIDFDPLRMTGHDFDVKIGLYHTSQKGGLSASFSLSVDL